MNNKTIISYFILYIVLLLFNIYMLIELVNDEIIVNTYTAKLSSSVIEKIIAARHRYSLFNYFIYTIYACLRPFTVALLFYTGSILIGIKKEFKSYLNITIIGEFLFVFFSYLRTILLYQYDFPTFNEIHDYQLPVTLLSILNLDIIPLFLYYPLSIVGIPEIIYWIVLTLLLKPLISGNFWNRIGFVAKTYGVGLLIWVSIVVFLTLNFTN